MTDEAVDPAVEAALRALGEAREARSAPDLSEDAVRRALALAPFDLEIRLGAYRFYFYNARLAEALPHAEFIIEHAARRLNIAADWRAVRAGDAPFSAIETAPGLYLQALLAYGYCQLRLGAHAEGAAALEKVADIDPSDRFGAKTLLAWAASRDDEDD